MDALNDSYSSVDGVLFDKSRKALIRYPEAKIAWDFTIPDTVTNVCNYAFFACARLAMVTFPDSVPGIGGWSVFEECIGLTNVHLGSSIARIGSFAFYGCTNLTSIRIPKSVIDLQDSAFSACYNLSAVYSCDAPFLGR